MLEDFGKKGGITNKWDLNMLMRVQVYEGFTVTLAGLQVKERGRNQPTGSGGVPGTNSGTGRGISKLAYAGGK